MQTQSDSLTYNRIFEEWNRIREALSGSTATEVDDPLGNDGLVFVQLNFHKANGGGEVVLRKGTAPADHRYTRFRAFGPNGSDTVEKTSFLVKADGTTEFHKRRLQNSDEVTVVDVPEADDEAWMASLS
jgi:hypothetical protein